MRDDLDLIQGTWAVMELEMEGQTISGGMLANARVEVTGNRFSSLGMGAVYEGTVTLDDSANPHQLNMKFDAGPEKGNTNLGIYEIDGDTWKICLATRSDVRPSEFSAPAGSGFVFETLTRSEAAALKKDKSPSPKAAAAPARSPLVSEVSEFEGEWRMVSAVMDGNPMDPSAVEWVKRVTHGNETTVYAGPQVMMKMEFTSDASKAPKTIDYLNTAGSNKGKSQQGIYDFEGGLLRVCVAPPGGPRPTQFQSNRGDGRTFTVWRRS
jgi:uncharacterized protein (TIGR03067 family)